MRKLTQKAIKSIQGHYGGAIRDHSGDVVAMRSAIWAIWHHRGRYHSKCGMNCATVDPENDLERTNKRALPKYVLAAIKPVFEKLTENELLQKCSHSGTQNANEFLHYMILDRSPKTVFGGRNRIDIYKCL